MKVIPVNTIHFNGPHAHVFTDTKIYMNYIIPFLNFTEMSNAFILAYRKCFSFLMSENILFRHHTDLGTGKLKAI